MRALEAKEEGSLDGKLERKKGHSIDGTTSLRALRCAKGVVKEETLGGD